MRQFLHISRLMILLALGCSIGVHWFVLQSVAWSSMLTRNLRTHSLVEAVLQTFDGNHPCALCLVIAKGRASEEKKEFPSPVQKLEFVSQTVAVAFFPPAQFELLPPVTAGCRLLAFPPPKPPPRA